MTTLSTHDTKRGEDVRARLAVLAELPGAWAAALSPLLRRSRRCPTRPSATCSGRRSSAPGRSTRERLHAYAEKATREAGDRDHLDRSGRGASRPPCTPRSTRSTTTPASTPSSPPSPTPSRRPAGPTRSASQAAPAHDARRARRLPGHRAVGDTRLVDPDNRRPVDFDDRAAAGGRSAGGRVDDAAQRSCSSPLAPCACAATGRSCSPATRRCGAAGRRPGTCSPSTAAARSPSRPGCRSGSQARRLGRHRRSTCRRAVARRAHRRVSATGRRRRPARDAPGGAARHARTVTRGRFDVWAPRADRLRLSVAGDDRRRWCTADDDWWSPADDPRRRTPGPTTPSCSTTRTAAARPAVAPAAGRRPPRSRAYDHTAFAWTDAAWTGRQLRRQRPLRAARRHLHPGGHLRRRARPPRPPARARRRPRRAAAGQRLQRRPQLGLRRRRWFAVARAVRRPRRATSGSSTPATRPGSA